MQRRREQAQGSAAVLRLCFRGGRKRKRLGGRQEAYLEEEVIEPVHMSALDRETNIGCTHERQG